MGWRARWCPPVVDAGLAVALAAVCILQGLDDNTGLWRPFDRSAGVLSALATLPVVFRRQAPVAVLLTCYGFWVWQILLGYVLLTGLAVPAVIAKAGDSARQLAAAHEARARQAVTEERLRLARELHDVVAHHMSVVAVQAGLARYVLRADPATAEGALDTVLSTSGEALGEMRRVLSLLRADEEPDDAPAPGLPGIFALAERVRAAGVPVAVEVAAARPAPRVLVLTTFDLDEYIYAALRAGASGFLLKETPPDRLLAAIRTVAQGDTLLAPSVTRRLVEAFAPPLRPGRPVPLLRPLTVRETEILRLVGTGRTNAAIAQTLVVSEATVKTHLTA